MVHLTTRASGRRECGNSLTISEDLVMQRILYRPYLTFGMLCVCLTTGWASSRADDALPTPPEDPGSSIQDEIWLLNTRHLGCPEQTTEPIDFRVSRVSESGQTEPADYADFIESQSAARRTVVYVHGNRNTYSQSLTYGLQVYRKLVASEAGARQPVCFLIWSWPSSQIKGPLRDVRVKASRADKQAYYFANFLAQLSPDKPVSLLGFSYGARILTGAVHRFSGESLAERTIEATQNDGPALSMVLVAAAVQNDWLCPGKCHGNALAALDQLLNVYNDRDPALKRYRVVSATSNPEALGYTGLPSACRHAPYRQINARCQVGRTHDIRDYIRSWSLRQRIRSVLLAPPQPDSPLAYSSVENN